MNQRKGRRRRYVWLLAVTALAIGGLLWADMMEDSRLPTVQTVTLSRQAVSETAVCTGTVAAGDGVEVYTTVPCVAGEVAVEVGDRVSEGDVLLTVDRSATLAMAVNAGLYSEATNAATLLPEAVVAPEDGVVSAVNVRTGETLTTQSPCVVLSERGGVRIDMVIRESVLSKIAVGQAVEVSGVAFAKDSYDGTVSYIASGARSRVSGTSTETVVDAEVTLDPDQIDDSLLIGLSAKATVTVNSRDQVLLLPYECLLQAENGTTKVYCMQDDTAVLCEVTVGDEFSGGVEVLDGLSEGARVVCAPESLSGERVRVAEETA